MLISIDIIVYLGWRAGSLQHLFPHSVSREHDTGPRCPARTPKSASNRSSRTETVIRSSFVLPQIISPCVSAQMRSIARWSGIWISCQCGVPLLDTAISRARVVLFGCQFLWIFPVVCACVRFVLDLSQICHQKWIREENQRILKALMAVTWVGKDLIWLCVTF